MKDKKKGEQRKRERIANHEENAMYIIYNAFFFIVKTVVYCIVLKKIHKFRKFVEENIRLIKVAFKKREFVPKNIIKLLRIKEHNIICTKICKIFFYFKCYI